MANITITLTEQELHAFQVAKWTLECSSHENMAYDEYEGNDHYARAYAGLESLEAKIDAKVQFETDVAYLREKYPNHTDAQIRKALRDHNKNQEG